MVIPDEVAGRKVTNSTLCGRLWAASLSGLVRLPHHLFVVHAQTVLDHGGWANRSIIGERRSAVRRIYLPTAVAGCKRRIGDAAPACCRPRVRWAGSADSRIQASRRLPINLQQVHLVHYRPGFALLAVGLPEFYRTLTANNNRR